MSKNSFFAYQFFASLFLCFEMSHSNLSAVVAVVTVVVVVNVVVVAHSSFVPLILVQFRHAAIFF